MALTSEEIQSILVLRSTLLPRSCSSEVLNLSTVFSNFLQSQLHQSEGQRRQRHLKTSLFISIEGYWSSHSSGLLGMSVAISEVFILTIQVLTREKIV